MGQEIIWKSFQLIERRNDKSRNGDRKNIEEWSDSFGDKLPENIGQWDEEWMLKK